MSNKGLPQTLWKFIWYFLSPYKLYLIIPIVFSIVLAAELSIVPYLLKIIIDKLSAFDKPMEHLWSVIFVPVIIYIGIREIVNWNFRLHDWYNIKVVARLKANIIKTMLEHLKKHSYEYFQSNLTGSLVNKISDICAGVDELLSMINMIFIWRLLALVIASAVMFTVHPGFAVILIVWGTLIVGATLKLSKITSTFSTEYATNRSLLVGKISDFISNIINSKLFPNVHYERKRIQSVLDNTVKSERKVLWWFFKISYIQGLSVTIFIACLLMLLIKGYKEKTVTIGDFALILGLANTFIPMIFALSEKLLKFFMEVGTCNQALTIITHPLEVANHPNAKSLEITKSDIEFKNVDFGYSKDKFFFNNVNVSIPAGQKVGLVGCSGGGKSTFINLLLRLYDIKKGSICIDEQDIKYVTKESLRQQIAVIPQEPVLFHRSVKENIRYGNVEATDEMIIEASKKAHCHDFIKLLDDGYDSLVGERGVKLSGGQRQRIAIARAVLKNSPIIIMDEASSALDSATENYIHQSLHNFMKNKTAIIIAHRLSTLRDMDRILFFKDGAIIEDGNFEYLLGIKGYFAKLWNMQVNGVLQDWNG